MENADITVLIVAKSSSLRDGLQALLTAVPQIKRIEQATDSALVLNLVSTLRPTLVLLDTGLATQEARTLLSQIKVISPKTRRVVLADTVQHKREIEAPAAEVVLLQGAPPATLLAAIETLLAG